MTRELLRIKQEFGVNNVHRTPKGDEEWFRHLDRSPKISVPWPTQVLSSLQRPVAPLATWIILFSTLPNLLIRRLLRNDRKSTHRHFLNDKFPDWEKENLTFRSWKLGPICLMNLRRRVCDNGSTIMLKFENHLFSPVPTHEVREI
jgi:hypothetical protein